MGVSVRELVCALSTLSLGSVREKLEMCFSVYDLDDSGYVLHGRWWGVWGVWECGGRMCVGGRGRERVENVEKGMRREAQKGK